MQNKECWGKASYEAGDTLLVECESGGVGLASCFMVSNGNMEKRSWIIVHILFVFLLDIIKKWVKPLNAISFS